MKEIWKDVQGYEGLYQVSNLGRVKSLTRKWVGGSNGLVYKDEMIIKPFPTKRGYMRVDLRKLGTRKTESVHRLVAIHFIKNPYNKLTVNHKKGNKTDNRASSLEWATQKENVNHSYKTGLKVNYKGTSHYRSTPILFISNNGSIIYSSVTAAARDKIISKTTLYRVLNGGINNSGFIIKYLNAS